MSDQDALSVNAARLVTDLMPIAIVVGGDGGEALAEALSGAGAGADMLAEDTVGPYDLAVLLADPAAFADAAMQARIAALTTISDRIVFIPTGRAGLDALTPWFEHFGDIGYQPVVEYDASYLGDGAFLVDRNATAAETDLAGFAERLSLGGALHTSTLRVAELEAELAGIAELRAANQSLQAALRAAEAQAAALTEEASVWAPLRDWIRAAVANADAQRAAAPPRRRMVARLFRRGARPPQADVRLDGAARIRVSKLFDAAWYIACHPELADTGQDPVAHYLLTGAAQGFDPGPWFDTAAYIRRHPEIDPAVTAPLLHAIVTDREAELLARGQ